VAHGPETNSLDFSGYPYSFVNSRIIFQDSLPLADRACSDMLQCVSVSYERILMKFVSGKA